MTTSQTSRPPTNAYPLIYSEGREGDGFLRQRLPSIEQLPLTAPHPDFYDKHPIKSHHSYPQAHEHPLQYSQEHPQAHVPHIVRQPYQTSSSSIVPNGFDDDAIPSLPMQKKSSDVRSPPQRRTAKKISQRRDNSNDLCVSDSPSTRILFCAPDQHRKSFPAAIEPMEDRSTGPNRSEASSEPIGAPAPSLFGLPKPPSQPEALQAAKASSALEGGPRNTGSTSDSARSMQISGLISHSDSRYHLSRAKVVHSRHTEMSRPSPIYTIAIRQQPEAARACGFGERDRRVIDPPPILQMTIEDPTATAAEISARLRLPYSVVHCTLWNAETDSDDTAMPDSGERRQQRRLMGNLVSSPFVGLDEHDVEGCFFTFPDLSCRTSGRYRLRFVLVVLDPANMRPGTMAQFQSIVLSDAFTVYAAKDFPGMKTSTALTKRLKNQGCLISVKKGSEKAERSEQTANSGPHESDDEEDDDEDELEVEEGTLEKSRKRQKK
ncbi:MAG: hypothetical protein M1818_007005 [Claussenomyces sp. TS43310]|nr:MAG: hypothetical protein M1818_007005 [Claussenomyces sp. TS43310]